MEGPLSVHERARLRIAHLKLADAEDLVPTLSHAARVSAATLHVARVGIWFLSADRGSLTRAVCYEAGAVMPLVDGDSTLPLASWPAYHAAVTSRRVVSSASRKPPGCAQVP